MHSEQTTCVRRAHRKEPITPNSENGIRSWPCSLVRPHFSIYQRKARHGLLARRRGVRAACKFDAKTCLVSDSLLSTCDGLLRSFSSVCDVTIFVMKTLSTASEFISHQPIRRNSNGMTLMALPQRHDQRISSSSGKPLPYRPSSS